MEMYGKATRWMYVKLWTVECDWKYWRKGSLFALILVYYLSFL